MSLPTIQPFDYPDWGTPGIFQTVDYNIVAVTGTNQELANVATGYFNHALIVFNGHGDGESYTARINYYTSNPIEGGSLMWSNDVVVMDTYWVVVPTTSAGGWIIVTSVSATSYPHNALFSITLFSAAGYQVGWPGGVYAMWEEQSVINGATGTFVPIGCGPGDHGIQVVTNGTDWDLFLRTYLDESTDARVLIADQTTAQPFDIRFMAPASSWDLQYVNNNAGTDTVTLIAVRTPT